jgi:Lipid A 3-O-deacylase (PagL)
MPKWILRLTLLSFLIAFTPLTYAWKQSVDVGYGFSHDPNHTRYNNNGLLVSANLLPLHVSDYLRWSLSGSFGNWRTTTPVNKNLTTTSVGVELRVYPKTEFYVYPWYFHASVGPAYISSKQFGYNTQGSHITGQWIGGIGMQYKCFDIKYKLVHYSSANITQPNQGFNILYMLSVGYLLN